MKNYIEITIVANGKKYEIISQREATRFAESLRIAGVEYKAKERSVTTEEYKAVLHRIAVRKQEERK